MFLGLLAILGGYGWLQAINFHASYGEPDITAYLWQAKRFAQFAPPAVQAENPFQFQEHMWVETSAGLVTSKYAPGLPLLMAIPWRVLGEVGPYLVNPVAGYLTLLGAFLLFCLWMDRWSALCATAVTGALGRFLIYTDYPLAHGVEMALTVWGMWLLTRWIRQPTRLTGLLAGAFLGFAVLVRHTSILLAPCVIAALCFVAWDARRHRHWPAWSPLVALPTGYAVFPLALGRWNWCLFGLRWRTGYALSHEQAAFSWAALQTKVPGLLHLITQNVSPALLFLGLFGLGCNGPARERVLRWLWGVPPILLYSAYYFWPDEPSVLRFLLVAWPLWTGCAFGLLASLPVGRLVRGSAAGLLLLLCLWHQGTVLQQACRGQLLAPLTPRPAAACAALETRLPNHAVLFTRALPYHGVEERRAWQVYNLELFTRARLSAFSDIAAHAAAGTPRWPPERTRRFREFYTTATDTRLRHWQNLLVTEALAAGKPVWFVLPPGQAAKEWKQLPRELEALPHGTLSSDDNLSLYEIRRRPVPALTGLVRP
ncbi:MAG: hypothetical protein WCH61_03720 [bacterium]